LVGSISKVEAELRQADANEKLQTALQLYSQGRNEESLKALDDVLKVQPGDSRAQRLMADIRAEIANQHVAEGRRLYAQRQFNAAIAQWKKAVEYGYDPRAADMLIARTKEQMRREVEAKHRAEAAAQQAAEEAQRKTEEEAKAKAEAEQKAREQPQQTLTPGAETPSLNPIGISEENRRSANDHYIQGINHFQNGNYEKAREEWLLCNHLDPSNADCAAGLQRIDQQVNGP
jgi:tetratricopeptide (TPR) repeat protein